jgi:hypothetical protein
MQTEQAVTSSSRGIVYVYQNSDEIRIFSVTDPEANEVEVFATLFDDQGSPPHDHCQRR